MGSPQISSQSINGASRVYGIIGFPVENSLSPNFWNGAFCSLGINAVYVPFSVKDRNQLQSAITGLQHLGIKGINVTAPYKEVAASCCNKLHGPAASIGAVNTIKFSQNLIEGWNTDATALLKLLEGQPSFKTATILGNGGVARSAVWALSKLGIEVLYVIARSDKPSFLTFANKTLSQSCQQKHWNKENILKYVSKSDLIINTTPLDKENDDSIPGLKDSLTLNSKYVNFNYVEKCSPNKKNNPQNLIISGKNLLMRQGIESFKILTDIEISTNDIEKFIFGK